MKKSLKNKIACIGCSLLFFVPTTFTPLVVYATDPSASDNVWDSSTDLTDDMAQDTIQSQQNEAVNDSMDLDYTMNENMEEANEFQSNINMSTEVQQELNDLQNNMNDSNTALDTFSVSPDTLVNATENYDESATALAVASEENVDIIENKSAEKEQKVKKDLDSWQGKLANVLDSSSLLEAWSYLNGEDVDKSDKDKNNKNLAYPLTSLFGLEKDWMNRSGLIGNSLQYDEDGKRIRENYSEGENGEYLGGSNLAQALTEKDLASFLLDISGNDRYKSRDQMSGLEQACRYGDNLSKFVANLVGKGEVNENTSLGGYLLRGYSAADYYNDKVKGEYTHDNLVGGGKSNKSGGSGDASN